MLPGVEFAEAELPSAERARAAAAVGNFLRALHDPAHAEVVADLTGPGFPVDPMGRANPVVRAARAAGTLDRLAERGIWPGDRAVAGLLDHAAQTADSELGEPGSLVVCHGDLHLRHVLVDEIGSVTGVIDWGDLCLGDPAIDLSIAYLAFDGRARDALLAAYAHPVGAARELAARTCALSLASALAEYAADDRRPVLLRESLAGIRRSAA